MPVYNGADTLAEALDSLLAQTFTDFEVLISDNASTDATEAICREYAERDARILYERNAENLGAAGNFNRVFDRAQGKYFKWFAADDLLAPEYLERCVAALDDAGEEFVLAFPGRQIVDPDGNPLDHDPYLISGKPADEQTYDDIGFSRLMRVCGSRCPIFVFGLMRTEVAKQTQGMGAYIAADLVYVAELRLRGRFRKVAGDLFLQRLHPPTPEVLARTKRSGDAAWFDTKKRKRWVFPEWRLLGEMIRAISRAPVLGGGSSRVMCSRTSNVTRPRWHPRRPRSDPRLWAGTSRSNASKCRGFGRQSQNGSLRRNRLPRCSRRSTKST